MKSFYFRFVICLFFVLNAGESDAQSPPNFELIKLEHSADYKAADPFALQTANYLLLTPFRKDNPDRLESLRFISRWMSGTPDYSFTFGDVGSKLLKGNNELLGIYMAGMAKYSLENKASAKDAKKVQLNSLILLLDYCEKEQNNIQMTRQLKKLSEARAKGELEQMVQSL